MRRIDLGDVALAVHEEGAGTPLLLVHGFPLNHTMWRAQIEEFRETHRVIAPDLRGFGESDVTPGVVGMQQHADDLARLLDAMRIAQPVVFCGLSMGGYIAWRFWHKYSHRVRAMILCDTRSGADSREAAGTRLKMADQVLAHGSGIVAEAMPAKLFARETLTRGGGVVDELRAMIAGTHPEGIAAAQRGMAERPDSGDLLASLNRPVLCVVGEEDSLTTPEIMRADAQAMPDAQLSVIRDAGHMAPMEQPRAVNKVLRSFLSVAAPSR